MSLHKARRGRPKGTGIDDSPMLEEIASLIAANSDLKPTTAIKALGVTDPSTIRRLRDKYKEYGDSPPSAANANRPTPRTPAHFCSESQRETRAMALVAGRDRTISEVVTAQAQDREPATAPATESGSSPTGTDMPPFGGKRQTAATSQTTSSPSRKAKRAPKRLEERQYRPTPFDTEHPTPFTAWMLAWRHGLKAYQDAANLQMAASRDLVNAPATQILIRQQIALSQMMLAMMPPTGFYPDTASILAGFPKR